MDLLLLPVFVWFHDWVFFFLPFLRALQTSLCVVGVMNINDLLEMRLHVLFSIPFTNISSPLREAVAAAHPLYSPTDATVACRLLTKQSCRDKGWRTNNTRCFVEQIHPTKIDATSADKQWFQTQNIALMSFLKSIKRCYSWHWFDFQ